MPEPLKTPIRVRPFSRSRQEELHLTHAKIWRRLAPRTPRPKKFAPLIWLRVQTGLSTQAYLQLPPQLASNEDHPLEGSTWPLSPLDESDRLKDINDTLEFGNHKGAVQQKELLLILVNNDVVRGFTLPLPLDKIKKVPGVLLAPLNIQLQKTINDRGKIIPKNRLTHGQSWEWQSGTSVNSRVDTSKLMPCYFGSALK
jgi:hypothetical protein